MRPVVASDQGLSAPGPTPMLKLKAPPPVAWRKAPEVPIGSKVHDPEPEAVVPS
jgi:hypothetical protein